MSCCLILVYDILCLGHNRCSKGLRFQNQNLIAEAQNPLLHIVIADEIPFQQQTAIDLLGIAMGAVFLNQPITGAGCEAGHEMDFFAAEIIIEMQLLGGYASGAIRFCCQCQLPKPVELK